MFGLVHFVVWSSYHFPSYKDFYCFIIVEGFFHMTWLYLFKERYKVPSVEFFYKEFKNMFSSVFMY